ncbi:MAG: hypothetical protein ACRDLN_00950 [Solirubrobacteraceae bacterium]
MHRSACHSATPTVVGRTVSGAAEIRIAGRGGVFVAHACRVSEDGLWLHAEGCFRRRLGPNNTEFRFDAPRSYSWPTHAVVEIRWAQDGPPV